MSGQTTANVVDWVVVALSGVLFLACAAGGIYTASYGGSTHRHAGAGFNYLWQSRLCFQLAGAGYALAQLLRLQVLWGPQSVFGPSVAHSSAMCRAYLAVEYGLLEPATLLLALFTCFYSIKSKLAPPVTGGLVWSIAQPSGTAAEPSPALTPKPGIAHPNFNIVFFALGFTLPCSTAQLLCALFSRIFGEYDDVYIYHLMFSAYDERETAYCPSDADPASCVWCVFPLLSTLISAAFLLAFLMALLVVTSRIAAAAISKLLIQRVRVLQAVVSISLMGSVVCRGVTVLFRPFDLGFELLRLGHVILSTIALLALSHLLIWQPVRDARLAERHVKQLQIMGFTTSCPNFQTLPSTRSGGSISLGAGVGAVSVVSAVGAMGAGGTFWNSTAAATAVAAANEAVTGSVAIDPGDVRLGSVGGPGLPGPGGLHSSMSGGASGPMASHKGSGTGRPSPSHQQQAPLSSSGVYVAPAGSRMEPERQPLVADVG